MEVIYMKVAVDLTGGDYSPIEIVRGIMIAIKSEDISPSQILVFGDEAAIKILKSFPELKNVNYRLCSDIIGMKDKPDHSDRKKDCSLTNGICSVRDGESDVFISAGNTSAIVTLATLILGRIKRKVSPAIAAVLPSEGGHCLLIDIGANANSGPYDLLNNAKMGSAYFREILGVENPSIGLLNIGGEIGKGHKGINHTYDLLEKSGLNFVGYVEGNDIYIGHVDVVITDGFTGNIVLKVSEGRAKMMFDFLKAEYGNSKMFYLALPFLICALPFLYPSFRSLQKKLDYNEYGGALLLGVDGNIIIAHGRSKKKAIAQAIHTAVREAELNISARVLEELSNVKKIPEE